MCYEKNEYPKNKFKNMYLQIFINIIMQGKHNEIFFKCLYRQKNKNMYEDSILQFEKNGNKKDLYIGTVKKINVVFINQCNCSFFYFSLKLFPSISRTDSNVKDKRKNEFEIFEYSNKRTVFNQTNNLTLRKIHIDIIYRTGFCILYKKVINDTKLKQLL